MTAPKLHQKDNSAMTDYTWKTLPISYKIGIVIWFSILVFASCYGG